MLSRLRFNLGFLLEAGLGTSREIELNYPDIRVADDVRLAPLTGMFQVTRTSEGIYFNGQLASIIQVECTRCLDPTQLPIEIVFEELFYYPPSTAPAGANVIPEEGIVDLAPLVRELSLLEVPIQVYCRPDCQGLCPECGENLNNGPCDCQHDTVDPRLSVLKSLLSNQ